MSEIPGLTFHGPPRRQPWAAEWRRRYRITRVGSVMFVPGENPLIADWDMNGHGAAASPRHGHYGVYVELNGDTYLGGWTVAELARVAELHRRHPRTWRLRAALTWRPYPKP